ncbi:G-type lectin S-receptor-like serine/threonine-protein kinase [Apostasia shenzhenica]|uniref:Receptor-like serine/threonine-protein kinase n=1 Tax=Apostasia shenzhenica TaxID=1088818 RepID=A0A2I0A9R7_9ASPA|nr:G-type lectin S-receptor-like serine/threonine-protein kinase [Apostasia shenzhenica]
MTFLMQRSSPSSMDSVVPQVLPWCPALHLSPSTRLLTQEAHLSSYLMSPSLRFLLLFLILLPLPLRRRRTAAAPVFSDVIKQNFTASYIDYIDTNGVFLRSQSSSFSASLVADIPQAPFVFSVLHAPTTTVVWSANNASAVPDSAVLSFRPSGLSLSFPNGSLVWSTGLLQQPAAALRLLDSGNLVLLDAANSTLWQSFDHPTDTILSTQRLNAGAFLSSPAGDYRLLVTDGDAVLLWSNGWQQYWRFSSDARSVRDITAPVANMADSGRGLNLFSSAGETLYEIALPPAELRAMKLESDGRFHVMSYSGNGSTFVETLVAPVGDCDLPASCSVLEICTTQSQGAICNCPPSFSLSQDGSCSPADGSMLAPPSSTCSGDGSEQNGMQFSYRSLGGGVGYFANKFAAPASSGGNLSSCQRICYGNCSCIAFFYVNSSKSCFLVKNKLGSLISTGEDGAFNVGDGYIKIAASPQPPPISGEGSTSLLLPILLPSIAVFFLLIILLFAGNHWRRRRRWPRLHRRSSTRIPPSPMKEVYAGRSTRWPTSTDDEDDESIGDSSDSAEILIPGLPTRLTYADLSAATDNFRTQIGSGGFGEVFRGELPDKTSVAVKRFGAGVNGIHGKREFLTEIAVIGNIHHVNLVRLRGFCSESRRLLVYEYMNRGSLDRSLFFPGGPVLEWQERMEIAVGTARGLAYLHSGCEHKIVHCDVKPENILLHEGGGIKISDFGLAKLIAPEQSALFTTMRGTRGYLAPEWLTNSSISDKTDVYSYGMVLLEIVRGRKNQPAVSRAGGSSCSGGGDVVYFPLAALEMHERGRYLELADPRLEGRVTEEELRRAVKVALCCLHEDPALRPAMAAVVAMLEGTGEVTEPRREALGFLRFYGRGFANYAASAAAAGSSFVVNCSYVSSHELSGPR